MRRMIGKFRNQDWFAIVVELVVVIVGIILGLQATEWSRARQGQVEARSYLQRLLEDNKANRGELLRAVNRDRHRAEMILSISTALRTPAQIADAKALDGSLCRWFIQPDIHLHRATYSELVSSGKLLLIHDQALRSQLAVEDDAHAESRRLDLLIPAVQHGAEPIDAYRIWRIDNEHDHGAACGFDIAGMRRDPRVGSALSQLYRQQMIYVSFREREIAAVDTTHAMLLDALKRTAP